MQSFPNTVLVHGATMGTIQNIDVSMRERLEKIGLSSPEELTLTITSLCNLHCRHCWPDSGPDKKNNHVPLESILRVVDLWYRAGLSRICITGGEPFLHPGWQQIIEYCCDLESITAVKVQTNGILLSEEIIGVLAQPRFQKVFLQISIDGEQNEHDSIRGPGSFQKTFATLERLNVAGVSSRTAISFTETEQNFEQLPAILQQIDALGISGLTSNTLVDGGRAKDDLTLKMPTPEQYIDLLTLYETDVAFRELYERRGNIAAIEWFKSRDEVTTVDTCSCMATPYINGRGQLFPCALLPVPYLAIDDVWEKSMEDILFEVERKWAQLHALSEKRSLWIAECRSCFGRAHCQSGCLGRSFPLIGDFFQREDRCLHRKAVYGWKKH